MFRPTRPSSDALKLRNCSAFCATAIGVSIFVIFLNEVRVVPPSLPYVLSFFGVPVFCLVCSVDVICLLLRIHHLRNHTTTFHEILYWKSTLILEVNSVLICTCQL
jgi:hypothetical protein